MPLDDDMVELDEILRSLRFADSDRDATKDLERARVIVANMRVEVLYLRARLGEAEP